MMILVRWILFILLVYAAVWMESKVALTAVFVLINVASEAASFTMRKHRDYLDILLYEKVKDETILDAKRASELWAELKRSAK